MSIWRQRPTLGFLNGRARNTLLAQLDIRFTEVGDDYLVAKMPVDARTHQPFGMLHGGASVALAESLGSAGANCCLDSQTEFAVGLEINANHVRSVRTGMVTATARPLHVGRRTQIWETQIADEAGRLVCVSRLTMAVLPRDSE